MEVHNSYFTGANRQNNPSSLNKHLESAKQLKTTKQWNTPQQKKVLSTRTTQLFHPVSSPVSPRGLNRTDMKNRGKGTKNNSKNGICSQSKGTVGGTQPHCKQSRTHQSSRSVVRSTPASGKQSSLTQRGGPRGHDSTTTASFSGKVKIPKHAAAVASFTAEHSVCENYPADVSTNSRTARTTRAYKADQSAEDEYLSLQERIELIVK